MSLTTSRYSSAETRAFAKLFSKILKTTYMARGKKQLEELVRDSLSLGEPLLYILKEKGKTPNSLERISIDSFGQWKWLDKSIIILDYDMKEGSEMKSSIRLSCEFGSEKDCTAALNSLKSEEGHGKRAKAKFTQNGKSLEVLVEAGDIVALRATMNSILRYLQVADNINGGNLDEE